jgi:hypothetical protein
MLAVAEAIRCHRHLLGGPDTPMINEKEMSGEEAKLDHLEPGEEAPRTNSHESSYRQQVHRLKRLLAEKAMEVDFFKGAFLGAPGAEFLRKTSDRKNFLGRGRRRPRPKIPRILGRRKENSSYGMCAQENCLTGGVHPTLLCPILCPI